MQTRKAISKQLLAYLELYFFQWWVEDLQYWKSSVSLQLFNLNYEDEMKSLNIEYVMWMDPREKGKSVLVNARNAGHSPSASQLMAGFSNA